MNEYSHILFSAGGLMLAIDSASVHSIHDGLIVQSEDGTHDWFLGVAVAEERLLPITDIGLYLHGRASQGRTIEIARDLGIAGLKIDDVYGVSQNIPEQLDLNAAPAIADSPLKNEAVNDLGEQYQLVDIASLMQASRFLNVQHEPA